MDPAPRPLVYCLVPQDLAGELLEPLRRLYADDPTVAVVVDRRVRERRTQPDRRHLNQALRDDRRSRPDRRQAGDRRAVHLPRRLPEPPAELGPEVARIRWAQPLAPVAPGFEELDLEAVVGRILVGDLEAPTELYWRCFERAWSRLAFVLGDRVQADGLVLGAFGHVLDVLEEWDPGSVAFEPWLDETVDACAAAHLAQRVVGSADESVVVAAGNHPGLRVTDPLLDEPVGIVAYDDRSRPRFHRERDALLAALAEGDVERVEHVGTTAVRGLGGSGVVDLLVGVRRLPPRRRLVEALEGLGYDEHGPAGARGRVYFRKRGPISYDVHVVRHGGPLWLEALALRDHLTRHAGDAQRYERALREAARAAPDSRQRYQLLRADALAAILGGARAAAS